MARHTDPTPSGAGPTGPEDVVVNADGVGVPGADDPIFDGKETEAQPTRRSTLLFQFFLFPLLIVVASVGVFLFFGAIGGSQKSAREYLADVRGGGENVQKQAAQQLATILQRERARVDAGEIKLADAEYSSAAFRRDLEDTFEDSFKGRTAERQAFLASAMGLVGDPAFLPALERHVSPTTTPEVRRAVARAISLLETRDITSVLILLLKDADEPVRNQAVEGLSRARARSAEATEALKVALTDESEYVRVNAAAALALAGDASGVDLVARLLDPAYADEVAARRIAGFSVEDRDLDPSAIAAMRQLTLANGLKAALALRAEALKPRVEALLRHPAKPVRDLAQQVLDRWGSPK